MAEVHIPHEQIARKAYELFERRGRTSGQEVKDWLEAEGLIKKEMDQSKRGRRSMKKPTGVASN